MGSRGTRRSAAALQGQGYRRAPQPSRYADEIMKIRAVVKPELEKEILINDDFILAIQLSRVKGDVG